MNDYRTKFRLATIRRYSEAYDRLVRLREQPATPAQAASDQETKVRAGALRAELETRLTIQQVEAAHEYARSKTVEMTADEILKRP
jgi:hypothetical protein